MMGPDAVDAPADDQSSLRSRLDRFLFAPIDARAAAIFRIALAAMLAIVYWPVPHGPAGVVERFPAVVDLYDRMFLTGPYLALIMFLIACFGSGVRPRAVGLMLVVLLAPLVLIAGVGPSRQLLLFTLLAFSLVRSDRCCALWPRCGATGETAGPIWPIRLIQIQVTVLYGINAMAKSTPDYLSGRVLEALSQTLPNFVAEVSNGAIHIGPIALPLAIAAIASVITEYTLAVGLWYRPTRIPVALLGVAFHVTMMWIVEIYWLGWTSMFLYLAFLIPFERRIQDS